jgi:hypothetical protein
MYERNAVTEGIAVSVHTGYFVSISFLVEQGCEFHLHKIHKSMVRTILKS